MKVFEYSNWRYDIGRHNDIMECVTCGEEISIGYVMALSADKVDDQINTDEGQRCSDCLAMFLSTTSHDVTSPAILKESN
jgi:DNA-directed RNA polymerase subunit RPC12/RpoP